MSGVNSTRSTLPNLASAPISGYMKVSITVWIHAINSGMEIAAIWVGLSSHFVTKTFESEVSPVAASFIRVAVLMLALSPWARHLRGWACEATQISGVALVLVSATHFSEPRVASRRSSGRTTSAACLIFQRCRCDTRCEAMIGRPDADRKCPVCLQFSCGLARLMVGRSRPRQRDICWFARCPERRWSSREGHRHIDWCIA